MSTINQTSQSLEQRVDDIEARLQAGSSRMQAIEKELAENTVATKQIAANTGELVAAFTALQGALRVLELLGRLAKPLGAIVGFVAAAVALLAMFKSGNVGGPKP